MSEGDTHYAKNPDLRNTLEQMDQSLKMVTGKDKYEQKNIWHLLKGMAFFVQATPIIFIAIAVLVHTNSIIQIKEIATAPAGSLPPSYQAAPTNGTIHTNTQTAPNNKWYIATEGLNIRQAASPREATIGEVLPKFTTLSLLDNTDAQWARVQVADGRVGYVPKKYIVPGDGEQARIAECNERAGGTNPKW